MRRRIAPVEISRNRPKFRADRYRASIMRSLAHLGRFPEFRGCTFSCSVLKLREHSRPESQAFLALCQSETSSFTSKAAAVATLGSKHQAVFDTMKALPELNRCLIKSEVRHPSIHHDHGVVDCLNRQHRTVRMSTGWRTESLFVQHTDQRVLCH